MLISEIISIKFPREMYNGLIVIRDDGAGQYIDQWNIDVPKPRQTTLDKWAEELDLEYRQKQAREARQYPSIQEQLDMQYWDKVNGTNIWQETIQAIKEANPIPVETTPV